MNKIKASGFQDQLNTKLQEVQMNRDASGLRLNDSKDHVEEMEKMLHILEEVQVTKRFGDERLQKTEEEALILSRKVKSLEHILKEQPCCGQCLHNLPAENDLTKESAAQQNKNHKLPTHPLNVEMHKEESVENLIDCVRQEMAVLSDKLSCPTSSSGVSLTGKLDILKKLIKKQLLQHESQVLKLKKILSCQEKRFSFLEEHLTCLQSQLLNSREEKAQISSQNFKDIFIENMVCSEHQQDLTEEEKTYFQALLDRNTQEGKKSQELLAEERVELVLELQDSQQHVASKGETTQQAAQYSCTSLNLHQQNVHLNKQLNNLKHEILLLKDELDHYKLSLASLEHQNGKLLASEAEHICRLQEEMMAKQQLSVKLERQGLQLHTLIEEHKELQQLYSCKIKESEGVVLQLQSHLKQAQTELDQVKCTLRIVKQKDNQGFEVARGMQKEITTSRQQIDSLKSKIQHLEETKEKLFQEVVHGKFENKHQFQELALVQSEKKQLAKELEAVKLKDKHLRERITELEDMIFQMTGDFADCQELIQLQEQEYYRLKLKHVMDVKQVRPSSDLGPLSAAQHGVISKKNRLHAAVGARSVWRRRPALERVQSTEFSCDKTEEMDCFQKRKPNGRTSHIHSSRHNDQSTFVKPQVTCAHAPHLKPKQ